MNKPDKSSASGKQPVMDKNNLTLIHPHILHEQGCNLGATRIVVDGLELVLHDMGVCTHFGKGCFAGHQHSYSELLIALSGEGLVRLGDTLKTVREGDVIFLRRGLYHEITWDCARRQSWRLLVMHFDIDLEPVRIAAPGVHPFRMAIYSFYDWFMRQNQLSMQLSAVGMERLRAMLEPENGRMGNGSTATVSCLGLLFSVLGLVAEKLCAQEQVTALPEGLTSGDSAAHKLHQAVRLIEERGGHLKVSVDEIARTTGLSASHFIRLFKALYGQSPHQYALEITMRHAGALLQSELSVKEIAFSLGYTSPSSFSRAFQEFFQYNPSEYRAKTQKGIHPDAQ
jgi:AraC-like DNA-binding protein